MALIVVPNTSTNAGQMTNSPPYNAANVPEQSTKLYSTVSCVLYLALADKKSSWSIKGMRIQWLEAF